MDLVPALITALVWAVLVVIPLAGLAMIAMPWVLDRAQEELRQRPPAGAPWARRAWRGRERFYLTIFGALAALGGGVFLLALLGAGNSS